MTERDEVTGLDQTWFRKNENRAGRWTSPDPYNGSMTTSDPQSFNRYSYVQNQPTNFVDPSGLNMSESSGGYCIRYHYSNQSGTAGFWGPWTCYAGNDSTGAGGVNENGPLPQTNSISQNCKNALSKAGLLRKTEQLLKSGNVIDVNSIDSKPASDYFGKTGTEGLTVGQWFDNRPHGGTGATTHTGDGVPGIYVRGGEASLTDSLKLHETAHLAQGGTGNLDSSLVKRLGIQVNKGQSPTDAVSNYFNSDCDPKLLKPKTGGK